MPLRSMEPGKLFFAGSQKFVVRWQLGTLVCQALPALERRLDEDLSLFAAIGIAASLLVIVVYGLVHGDWLQAVLAGIALGMSMLPEEFPLVLTAFMVMGAWRLSRARVLTRRGKATGVVLKGGDEIRR